MKDYFITAILFGLLDGMYLYLIKDYFNKQIKDVQGSPIQINFTATIITYLFLIYGINYFIIQQKKSVWDAAILGFVIYGVYEFTNLSLIKNWYWSTALMDTLWGAVLFALITTIIYRYKSFS
jgi:uncharacterized membrane protein